MALTADDDGGGRPFLATGGGFSAVTVVLPAGVVCEVIFSGIEAAIGFSFGSEAGASRTASMGGDDTATVGNALAPVSGLTASALRAGSGSCEGGGGFGGSGLIDRLLVPEPCAGGEPAADSDTLLLRIPSTSIRWDRLLWPCALGVRSRTMPA